jgi:predicted transcriptional regulator
MKEQKNSAVTVKLEESTKARLNRLGKIRQRSNHWLMKQAIEQYLEHEEYEELEKQETLRRWREAQNGLVIEHDKVETWLDTWGTDLEKEQPKR